MPRDSLDAAALVAVLVGVCDAMGESIADLTHADQAVGDGDHGLAIGRGVAAARSAVVGLQHGDDIGALFDAFGTAMLSSMGGASGAIYGTLFRRGGAALRGRTVFDAEALALFLEGGLVGVRERGKAAVGDKTLVDALQPASEAARAATSGSLADALAAATAAAGDGLERTRAMQATLGRARTLGDRAVGHVDPGALSFTLMLRAWMRLVREP
ncbi:MAG: dihydroxyacetone kinase subunit DhaL [Candidatus Limnocylindrales bacterium]